MVHTEKFVHCTNFGGKNKKNMEKTTKNVQFSVYLGAVAKRYLLFNGIWSLQALDPSTCKLVTMQAVTL